MRFSLLVLLSLLVCLVQFNWAVDPLSTTTGATNSSGLADASESSYDGTGRLLIFQETFQFLAHARVIRDDDSLESFYRRGRRSPGGKNYVGPSIGGGKSRPGVGLNYGAGAGRGY